MGLFDLFSDKNEKKAANAQKAGLDAGRTAAYGYLDTGLAGATDQYGTAKAEFDPYAARYESGASSYADALGLGGPEGTARVQGQFAASPGYQFQQDEAAKAALRSGSAAGMLGSGNTYAAILGRSSDLANQEYGGYLDRLSEYDQRGLTTAGARAGIDTGLGDVINNTNVNKADIGWQTETGKGQATANYQLGKDRTGQNIFSAVTGGLKLAAPFLSGGASIFSGSGAGAGLNAAGYRGLI